jgi:hypothetical protein
MVRRGVIFITMLGAALIWTDVAVAQLSPRGIIGGITRPFREMFGRFGHFPHREHRPTASEQTTSNPTGRDISASPNLASTGPANWPTAFEDVLGFTFSPDEYAQKLHGRGFDVIADAINGHNGNIRPVAHIAATTGAKAEDDAVSRNSADSCSQSIDRNNWPAARIEQRMQLRDAQREALDKLQAAINQSAKTINGDCRTTETSNPSDRLNKLIQTVWAVRDSVISIRVPMKEFFDTLDDKQKALLMKNPPQEKNPAGVNNNEANKQYQACAGPNIEASERMIMEIKQRIRPSNEQAESLENLHKTSSSMAKLLMASCASPAPADPMARLDAAVDQLTAMNYAATTVQIAFDAFYRSLDDEQTAKFESSVR